MLIIETFTKQLCERDLQRIMLNAALERACLVQLSVRETLIMQAQAGHLKSFTLSLVTAKTTLIGHWRRVKVQR